MVSLIRQLFELDNCSILRKINGQLYTFVVSYIDYCVIDYPIGYCLGALELCKCR
jgi:hypothetical protein